MELAARSRLRAGPAGSDAAETRGLLSTRTPCDGPGLHWDTNPPAWGWLWTRKFGPDAQGIDVSERVP